MSHDFKKNALKSIQPGRKLGFHRICRGKDEDGQWCIFLQVRTMNSERGGAMLNADVYAKVRQFLMGVEFTTKELDRIFVPTTYLDEILKRKGPPVEWASGDRGWTLDPKDFNGDEDWDAVFQKMEEEWKGKMDGKSMDQIRSEGEERLKELYKVYKPLSGTGPLTVEAREALGGVDDNTKVVTLQNRLLKEFTGQLHNGLLVTREGWFVVLVDAETGRIQLERSEQALFENIGT
jgi:hypothetical protein